MPIVLPAARPDQFRRRAVELARQRTSRSLPARRELSQVDVTERRASGCRQGTMAGGPTVKLTKLHL